MRKSELAALGFKDGRITGFTPRFRSIDDDWDRYTQALVELERRGDVVKPKGTSLYNLYCTDLNERLAEAYFEKGCLNQIEAHYTPSGEVSFGPLHEGTKLALTRFEAMGEGARVRRIWRGHVGLMRSHYWFYVGEKTAGFRIIRTYAASEARQRKDYEALIAQVPELKTQLLEIMAEYISVATRNGASAAELDRIDGDIASIAAEARPRPPGKADPRAMDEALFWELIDEDRAPEPIGERLDTLPTRLARYNATAIRAFEKHLAQADARAYRWDIWALAYLLQGGCSDNAFEEFRGWLILQGRTVFEATQADPDGFDVTLHNGQASGMEGLRDAAPQAYEMRQGKPMPPLKIKPLEVAGTEIAEEDFAAALPRIASLTGNT